jgi:hypothetical protein
MTLDPALLSHPAVVTAIIVILALLTVWTILRFVARVVAGLLLTGLLVVGLVVAVGRLTGRPPATVVAVAVEAVTAEATRVARDLPAFADFGRLDRMGEPRPSPRP